MIYIVEKKTYKELAHFIWTAGSVNGNESVASKWCAEHGYFVEKIETNSIQDQFWIVVKENT